jgi:hypothetical protein
MSRGLGKIERAVLETLRGDPTGPWDAGPTVTALAKRVYGPAPTTVQLVSFRRALRSLQRKGFIIIRRSDWWYGGRRVALAEPPPVFR